MKSFLAPPSLCAAIAALVLLAGCSASSDVSGKSGTVGGAALSATDKDGSLVISDGKTVVTIARNPWRLSWTLVDGTLIVKDAEPGSDPVNNPKYESMQKADGVHKAYPGLPTQSFKPLAWYDAGTASWNSVTALKSYSLAGNAVTINAETTDAAGATVTLSFDGDGALHLQFRPLAASVAAVEAGFDAPAGRAYYGTGQRFGGFDTRGISVPLWISHGGGADRYSGTNEISTSFFWSPAAKASWGLWSNTNARGEMDFGDTQKRDDAVSVMHEDDHLDVVMYQGTPQQIVSAHTQRAGRPKWTPPLWTWLPMIWQDDDTTTDTVNALVDGMLSRDIPLGAVWLDNPWDAGKGSFDFDPARFADPDALIKATHDKGVRLMVWTSPYMSGDYQKLAADNNWLITGTRADNNDATYYPVRGLDPHLDFNTPAAYDWWVAGMRKLVARGVDGVKMDRCEEDLSEDSVWSNGLPNRLNHNIYCVLYHRAAYDAFIAERPDGDFSILARGGWNGDAQYTGHWAADNKSLSGPLGLTGVFNSLLSLSSSGFPFNGSDIGGYAGTRQSGPAPVGLPDTVTFARWAQLGAFSPIMECGVPPWWVNNTAVKIYKRYATLRQRLVPYIAAAAKESIDNGVPIVRPIAFAYPDAAPLPLTGEEYLFGPDLLVAPVTSVLGDLLGVVKTVYIPRGKWTNFWTGKTIEGPTTTMVSVALDQIPLFVRDGAKLPDGVSADALP